MATAIAAIVTTPGRGRFLNMFTVHGVGAITTVTDARGHKHFMSILTDAALGLFALVALSLLFAATALAAFVPARRIGRIEPQALLRQE